MTAPGPESPIRVVVADDSPEIRMLLRMTLDDPRFEVVAEATDGAQAIRLVDVHQPDAVVIDLAMPEVDGFQAISGIRALSPRTKILVLSAYEASQTSDKALRSGAHAYLEKGGGGDEVARVLLLLCDQDDTIDLR